MMDQTPTSDRSSHEELVFGSDGSRCAATLYMPQTPAAAVPCIVMAPGVTQTRRDGFPRFADEFAAAGFAALVIDFRYLGDSEGEPRQLIDYEQQRADLVAAIDFARTLSDVDADQIVAWGFSFGGGHVVNVAARDSRLAAAIVLCPFVDGLAFTLAMDVGDVMRFMRETGRALLGRRPIRVPVFGSPKEAKVFSQPEAREGFRAVRGSDSRWRNEYVQKPTQLIATNRPVRDSTRVACPLLVGLGTQDTMVPSRPIRRLAQRAQDGQLHEFSGGHFEGFLDNFEEVVDAQVTFLQRHLVTLA